jgi:UDPglucose 6-dehydrogenase
MKVGIVGAGAVGAAMAKLFSGPAVYDPPKGLGSKDEINACDVVFVSVPTPQSPDGSCDTSIVEDVVSWITAPVIVLRSTVSVGTSRRLAKEFGKKIVFQPEYGPAETPDHPFNDLRKVRWVILGGEPEATKIAARAWMEVYNSDITIQRTTWEAAELCKYMENAYLAMKVTFCNEFFDIAQGVGVDYEELRELWLLDPRIGKSHTFVFPDKRGFGGKCLPKDLAAITRTAQEVGAKASLLEAVIETNARHRSAKKK